jgi:hypothetical protein
MNKYIKILTVVIFVLILSPLSFAQETITVTTYYPSPYGSYKILNILNLDESTTQTDFTQALTKAGLLITTDYTASAFTPGIFWSTSNNMPTKPKAGIYLLETGTGTRMYFGTSSDYATGINNDAVVINEYGNVGIGSTAPNTKLEVAGEVLVSGGAAGTFPHFDSNFGLAAGYTSPVAGRLLFGDGSGWKFMISSGTAASPTDRVTIQDNGNVGIGTTTPGTYRLYVSGGEAYCDQTTCWNDASDIARKTNIKTLSYGLSEVLRLNPVRFTSKSSQANVNAGIGLIAQDVETIVPEVVSG